LRTGREDASGGRRRLLSQWGSGGRHNTAHHWWWLRRPPQQQQGQRYRQRDGGAHPRQPRCASPHVSVYMTAGWGLPALKRVERSTRSGIVARVRVHPTAVLDLERGSYFILSHRGLERSRTRYLATRTAVLRGFYRYVQQTKIDRRVHPCSGLFLGRECTRQVLSSPPSPKVNRFWK
jgi:hypothetical protein